jgi:hypothetical protein
MVRLRIVRVAIRQKLRNRTSCLLASYQPLGTPFRDPHLTHAKKHAGLWLIDVLALPDKYQRRLGTWGTLRKPLHRREIAER